MRTAILESKEKSQTIANTRDNDMGEHSPSEYASGKVAYAEEWAARKTGRTITRAGKIAAQASYEKIKQRAAGKKEAEKEVEKEYARGTGDTQTADPTSRKAPEQKIREASSNALTVRMQKQMERRAATQAAKKAAVQTSEGVRRLQKTVRAGENTFKAAKAAVEAAVKSVQSMMAALGAAGAVIVLLLVIMIGIIGGAAFSGSSESNEALSQEVLSYTSTIQKYASQYRIPEYVSVIQAIMM